MRLLSTTFEQTGNLNAEDKEYGSVCVLLPSRRPASTAPHRPPRLRVSELARARELNEHSLRAEQNLQSR